MLHRSGTLTGRAQAILAGAITKSGYFSNLDELKTEFGIACGVFANH